MLNYLLTLAVGVAIGTLASVVGVGGGFLAVPYLMLVASLPPMEAVGTSLVMVTGTGYSSTLGYLKRERPHIPLGLTLGLMAVPGVYLGYHLLSQVSEETFKAAFGVTLIVIAIYLGTGTKERLSKGEWGGQERGKWYYYSPMGVLGGLISAFFGVGGGVIYTPYLIIAPRMRPKVAVGTSLLAIAVSGTFAIFIYGLTSHISASHAVFLLTGTVIGSQIGVRLSGRLKGKHIVLALSAIVLLTGIRMLLSVTA
ncbi:MAG: sulfite exporter TauE/SafE family protein [Thermoplasmata archaeon]|nr:sulfite exporter TauE/SafE family protein [Thermoplasmata archaeon]